MSPVLIAWGMPCFAQRVGPVAALAVVVLDVVVDEAEVVAELDRGGARQRAAVVAGDRGVGEEAQERPHPLAGRARAVQPEVVAAHLVDAGGRRVRALDEAQDLRLRVGDQLGDVRAGRERHRGECSPSGRQTCSVEGSAFAVRSGHVVERPGVGDEGRDVAPVAMSICDRDFGQRLAVRHLGRAARAGRGRRGSIRASDRTECPGSGKLVTLRGDESITNRGPSAGSTMARSPRSTGARPVRSGPQRGASNRGRHSDVGSRRLLGPVVDGPVASGQLSRCR